MTDKNRQVAIVTGGAYGIGRAISRRFAAEHWRVVVADLDGARGAAIQDELRGGGAEAMFCLTDVSREDSVRDMIGRTATEWSRIDLLVNNAGIEIYNLADEQSLEQWDAVVDTNLRGPWLCAKYAAPYLKESRGSIVNIASIQGIACERRVAPYAATKGGLLALTRGMALDFAPFGIRVNAVCPGAVHTGLMEKYLALSPDSKAMIDGMAAAIPIGRVGQPEDIAGPVWFLASEDARYITGTFLAVDGGVLARHAL